MSVKSPYGLCELENLSPAYIRQGALAQPGCALMIARGSCKLHHTAQERRGATPAATLSDVHTGSGDFMAWPQRTLLTVIFFVQWSGRLGRKVRLISVSTAEIPLPWTEHMNEKTLQPTRRISIATTYQRAGVSKSTFCEMTREGSKRFDPTFPKKRKCGGRRFFIEAEVEAWLLANPD